MAKEKFKTTYRNTKRGGISSATVLRDRMQAENVAQDSDGAPLNGWELFLERIRVGSSLDQEAERLQVSVHTLRQYVYNKRFEHRKQEYREARQTAAEVVEEELQAKARELLQPYFINEEGERERWSRDQIAARDKGLYHAAQRQKYQNRALFGDAQTIKHEHDVSGALLERLEKIAAERKEHARLSHMPGKTIDAEFVELSEARKVD